MSKSSLPRRFLDVLFSFFVSGLRLSLLLTKPAALTVGIILALVRNNVLVATVLLLTDWVL